MLKNGEKRQTSEGPEKWHETSSWIFLTWSWCSWQTGNANRQRQKSSDESLLSVAKGIGKGAARQMSLLQPNHRKTWACPLHTSKGWEGGPDSNRQKAITRLPNTPVGAVREGSQNLYLCWVVTSGSHCGVSEDCVERPNFQFPAGRDTLPCLCLGCVRGGSEKSRTLTNNQKKWK